MKDIFSCLPHSPLSWGITYRLLLLGILLLIGTSVIAQRDNKGVPLRKDNRSVGSSSSHLSNSENETAQFTEINKGRSVGGLHNGLGTLIEAIPSFNDNLPNRLPSFYNNEYLFQAVNNIADSLNILRNTLASFSDDCRCQLITYMSQWYGNQFADERDKFNVAFRHRNLPLMRQQAQQALSLIHEVDTLLALYPFAEDNRLNEHLCNDGGDPSLHDDHMHPTRMLIAYWGESVILDYANRKWSGLLGHYYASRWELFFEAAITAVEQQQEFNLATFNQQLVRFDNQWFQQHEVYPIRFNNEDRALHHFLVKFLYHNDYRLVADAADRVLQQFPQSNLQDFYKSNFQERFGTGHLVGKERTQGMIDYIDRECQYMIEQEGWQSQGYELPRYELAGLKGDYVRVNLSVVLDSLVSASHLADCFVRGAFAIDSADIANWQCRWEMRMVDLQPYRSRLGSFEADSTAIQQLFAQGKYAYHHSARFNAAYHYHYRLIRRDIFELELLPLIEKTPND